MLVSKARHTRVKARDNAKYSNKYVHLPISLSWSIWATDAYE